MDRIGLQQRVWRQPAAVEVVVDGLAKVLAAGKHSQGQLNQRLPTQRRLAERVKALVVEQPHSGFAECQGIKTFAVETLQVGHAEVQPIVRQLFEDLFGTQRREFEAQVRVFGVQE